jgi:hypothetical protein
LIFGLIARLLAVVDISGRFLAQEVVMISSDAEQATARIVERMQELRRHLADKSFEGIGVSVPGRVHPVTQQILLAPNLKWHGFDLKGALEQGLDLQVVDRQRRKCLPALGILIWPPRRSQGRGTSCGFRRDWNSSTYRRSTSIGFQRSSR